MVHTDWTSFIRNFWQSIYTVKPHYNTVIFSPKYWQKTLYSSPVRARYGVSFVSSKNSIIYSLCVQSFNYVTIFTEGVICIHFFRMTDWDCVLYNLGTQWVDFNPLTFVKGALYLLLKTAYIILINGSDDLTLFSISWPISTLQLIISIMSLYDSTRCEFVWL